MEQLPLFSETEVLEHTDNQAPTDSVPVETEEETGEVTRVTFQTDLFEGYRRPDMVMLSNGYYQSVTGPFRNCINTNKQGNVGMAFAHCHLTQLGFDISFPVTDSQPYDLHMSIDTDHYPAQVKTTRDGNVKVATRYRYRTEPLDPNGAKYMYIFCEWGAAYLIPYSDLKIKYSFNVLHPRFQQYRIF